MDIKITPGRYLLDCKSIVTVEKCASAWEVIFENGDSCIMTNNVLSSYVIERIVDEKVKMDIKIILEHYLICSLWSSTEIGTENPLDEEYGVEDFTPEALEKALNDVEDFVHKNEKQLKESDLSDEQIGHDFWLTRNGHGAGFWDRGLEEIGEALSEATKKYGEIYPYASEGKVYF